MDALSSYRVLRRAVSAEVARVWRTSRRRAILRPPCKAVMETLEPRQLLSVTASFSGTAELNEGSAYTLFLHASSTEGSTHLNEWNINWGDGHSDTPTSGASFFSHTYSSPSSGYCVNGYITDDDSSSYACTSVKVDEVTPTLGVSGGWTTTACGPADGPEESTYFLTTSFFDFAGPGADHVSEWDVYWGDGGASVINASSSPSISDVETFTHVYSDAGNYAVSAVAHTVHGSYTVSATADVDEASPTVWATGAEDTSSGSSYLLDVFFSDSGHDVAQDWLVDWGDGSSTFYSGSGNSEAFHHSYASNSSYAIHIYEFDVVHPYSSGTAESGVSGHDYTLDVLAGNPLTFYDSSEVLAGSSDTVTGTYSDVRGNAPYSWEINWGDGTWDGLCSPGCAVSDTWCVSFSHSYSTVGSHSGVLEVFGADGTFCDPFTIQVDYSAPVATVSAPGSANRDASYIAYDFFSDVPGRTVDHWCVIWGDGSSNTYTGNPGNFSHEYSLAGSYAPTFTVIDSAGVSSSVSSPVTINEVAVSGAWIGGSCSVSENSEYQIDGGVYDPLGLPTSDWTWRVTWGDGFSNTYSDSAEGFSHYYQNAGDYSVTLYATESDRSASCSMEIEVTEISPNMWTPSVSSYLGASASVSAQFCDAGGHAPTSWSIEWGDGTSDTNSGYCNTSGSQGMYGFGHALFNHSYTAPGDYTYTVIATDSEGSYSVSCGVSVMLPPVSLCGPSTAQDHASFPLDATIPVEPGSWVVNWGDGTSDDPDLRTFSGSTYAYNHTYTHVGNYTATVTALIDGYCVSMSSNIEVDEGTPWFALYTCGPACQGADAPIYAGFEYADGTGAASITVNWGDGSGSTFSGPNTGETLNHVYSEPGSYTVAAVAFDAEGYCFSCSVTEEVNNVPPMLSIQGDTTVVEGSTYSLNLQALYPATVDNTLDTWFINWGDGADSDHPDITSTAGSTTNLTHSYTTAGQYAVTASATDDYGDYGPIVLNGQLDVTFGTNGIVTTDFNDQTDTGRSVALQPDGSGGFKIIAAGETYNATTGYELALARYNADGSLDTSFGATNDDNDNGGAITAPFGGYDAGASLLILSDGSIIVGGIDSSGGFALAHYSANGILDTTGFGTSGIVTTDFSSYGVGVRSMVEQNLTGDDRILVGGSVGGNFEVAAYTLAGSLDTTFNTTGKLSVSFAQYAYFGGLAIDGSHLILAGTTNGDFALASYNADGSANTSFGTGGTTTTALGSDFISGVSVAIQSNGKIDLTGTDYGATHIDFAVAQYTVAGILDSTFNATGSIHGVVTTAFPTTATANAIALQKGFDGSTTGILVAGESYNQIAIANYSLTGTLNSQFGIGGLLQTAVGDNSSASSLMVQPDGKILLVGSSDRNLLITQEDLALTRYQPDNLLTVLPESPAIVAAVAAAANKVSITWTDSAADVASFDIERSDDAGATYAVIANVDSSTNAYTDWSVDGSTTYFYEIRANIDGGVLSATSLPTSVTTPVSGVTDLGDSGVDEDEIDISWIVAASGVSSIQINRSVGGGAYAPLATLAGDATGYQDTSLSPGTLYSYEVCTVDTGGTSAFSVLETWTLTDSAQSLDPITVTSGDTFNGVVADFSGTFADGDLADYSATIDWGDGSSSSGTVASDGNGGFNVSGIHAYIIPAQDVLTVALQQPTALVAVAFGGVWVPDKGPTVTTAASATLSADGTTATLNVLGGDNAGEDDLTYTWSTLGTPPAAVTFDENGDNDSSEAIATFTATGTYDFRVTIENSAGLSTTSDVSLDVTQVASDVEVTPDSPTVTAGDSVQLSATEYDQFGVTMAERPTFYWSVQDGEGTVDATGLYSVPVTASGTADVRGEISIFTGLDADASIAITPVVHIDNASAVSTSEIDLSYTVPTAMRVELEQETSGGNFSLISSALPSGSDPISGLAPNTTYSFRLRADLNGQVIYSDAVSATTDAFVTDDSAPPPVLTHAVMNASFVNWAQADYDSTQYTPAGLIVQVADPLQAGVWDSYDVHSAIGGSDHPLLLFDNLPNPDAQIGVPWADETFRVIESYGTLTGLVYSEPSTISMPITGAVTAPSGLQYSYNDGEYAVSWTVGDDSRVTLADTATTIHGVDVNAGTVTGTTWGFGGPNTINAAVSAPPGYAGGYFAVWSTGDAGYSTAAAIWLPPVPLPPPAPTNVGATAFYDTTPNSTGLGVHVVWDNNADNEEGYQILRSDTTEDGSYTVVGTVAADVTNYDDTNVPLATNHYYKVRSMQGESGTDSEPCSILVPAAPTGLTATRDDTGTINLTWNSEGASGYEIQWSSDGTNFVTIDTVEQSPYSPIISYSDESPTEESQNYYRLVAYVDNNPNQVVLEGPPSSVVSDEPIDAPVAVDETDNGLNSAGGFAPYVSQRGAAVSVSAANGVLADDWDPAGLAIHVSDYEQPDNGSVVINPDGSFTYTPDNGFLGTDYFEYTVTSTANVSSTATIAVDCFDPAPSAKNAFYNQDSHGQVSAPAHTLDSDVVNPSGGTLTFRVASGGMPHHGTLTFNADGSFTYSAKTGFHGWDHFTYVVNDGYADSNAASVTLAPVNTPVTAGLEAVHHGPTPAGLTASYNEAQSRLNALSTAAQAYKTVFTTFSESLNPDDEDGMNAVIAAADTMQTAFNSYLNQYNHTSSLVKGYTRGEYSWQVDHTLIDEIALLPADPFQIKLNQDQINEFVSSAAANGDGTGYWLDSTTHTIKVLKTTHTVLQVISLLGGVGAVGQKLIISAAAVAAKEGACAAAWQLSKQIIANVIAAGVVNVAQNAATKKLATELGLSEDTVQIIGDSFQLVCLLNAWRLERLATGVGCFTGNTAVKAETSAGVIDEPIDDIHDGQRIDAIVNDGSGPDAPPAASDGTTAVDPTTWREVDLSMPDPTIPGDTYTMQLLEPLSWIAANNAIVGNWVNLDLPELQVSGLAKVTSIKACPAIQSGPGDVVLGTFQHVSNDIVDVQLSGANQSFQVTAGHLLWSLDRDGWVQAGELRQGERLAGENGPIVVQSVTADSISQTVYNLDVETDHRYLVADLGILAHNASPCTLGPGAPQSAEVLVKNPNLARQYLRDAMDLTDPNLEAHHLIPRSLLTQENTDIGTLLIKAAKGGFNLNGAENGVAVPSGHGIGENSSIHAEYAVDVAAALRKRLPFVTDDASAATIVEEVAQEFRLDIRKYWPSST